MNLLPARFASNFETLSFLTLCIAAIIFPFSVAISNMALGCAVGAGILGGALVSGMRYFWQNHRLLSLACWAYPILLLLGLIWSLDRSWGIHIATKYWYWFLIPIATALLTPIKRRELFLACISLGLTSHLFFCVGQILGLTDFTIPANSSASNATGHIGHIGFGFVYGTWACWLLHWGSLQLNWKRWAAWALAVWSILMVFLAEGRSGYIIIIILLLVMIWKLMQTQTWKKALTASLACLILLTALSAGPGMERVKETWQSIQNIQQGHFEKAESRWSYWYTALKAWQDHKFIGVGTGGYPVSAEKIKLNHPELAFEPGATSKPAHPHNIYLLALSRWGPAGLVIMLFLLVTWARAGWRENWQHSDAGSLITLPALAMIIHGLSSSSLEEHFSGIIAVFLLTAGFASLRSRTNSYLSDRPDGA